MVIQGGKVANLHCLYTMGLGVLALGEYKMFDRFNYSRRSCSLPGPMFNLRDNEHAESYQTDLALLHPPRP